MLYVALNSRSIRRTSVSEPDPVSSTSPSRGSTLSPPHGGVRSLRDFRRRKVAETRQKIT